MPDEMDPLDAERIQRALGGLAQAFDVTRPGFFARSAMTRQIQRDDAAPFCKSGLCEHPGIEIGAKAVQQQDGNTRPSAEVQAAQPQTTRVQLTRPCRFGL